MLICQYFPLCLKLLTPISILWGLSIMPIRTDKTITQSIDIVRTILSEDESTWIPIKLRLFSELKGSIVSIEELSVQCSDAKLCLPWKVQWNEIPLLPGTCVDEQEAYCGITNMTAGWSSEHLSPILRQNIEEFAFSVLQQLYIRAKKEMMKSKKILETYSPHLKKFYVGDQIIACMMISSDDENNGEDDHREETCALIDFVQYLLRNESTLLLLEYFSDATYEKLLCNDIDLLVGPEKETFPLQVSVMTSVYEPRRLMKVIPLSAVCNMIMYFQVLEQNNHITLMSNNDDTCPEVFVKIPRNISTTVCVHVKISHCVHLKMYDEQSNRNESSICLRNLHPETIVRSHHFVSSETEEEFEKVLQDYKDINSLKCSKSISIKV